MIISISVTMGIDYHKQNERSLLLRACGKGSMAGEDGGGGDLLEGRGDGVTVELVAHAQDELAGADISIKASAAVEIGAVPAVVELVFGEGRNRTR